MDAWRDESLIVERPIDLANSRDRCAMQPGRECEVCRLVLKTLAFFIVVNPSGSASRKTYHCPL